MAHPNRTVAAFRRRENNPNAMFAVFEEVFNTEAQADAVAAQMKATGDYRRVIVKAFKIGPRPNYAKGIKQAYHFTVRAYK